MFISAITWKNNVIEQYLNQISKRNFLLTDFVTIWCSHCYNYHANV